MERLGQIAWGKTLSEDGDKAVVEAEITNTDMGTVFTELFAEVLATSFAQVFSDEELELDVFGSIEIPTMAA